MSIPPLTNTKECPSGNGHNFKLRWQAVVEQVHNVSSYAVEGGRAYMTVDTHEEPAEWQETTGGIMRVECGDCDISLPVTGMGIRYGTAQFMPCEIVDDAGFAMIETGDE